MKFIASIIFLMLLTTLINGVQGQENDLIPDYPFDVYYSADLKQGMEFTWQFTQYETAMPEGVNPQQVTTTYYTSTTTGVSEKTEFGTTTYSDNGPEFPEFSVGTKVSIKLKKDLFNITGYQFFNIFQSWNEELFEVTVDGGTLTQLKAFFPANIFISPSNIIYRNGTEVNYFEFQYANFQRTKDRFPEEMQNRFSLENDIFRTSYNYTKDTYTTVFNTQIDIQTGLLLEFFTSREGNGQKIIIEIKLVSTKGIDLNYLDVSGGSLELPFSTYFIYSFIIITIIKRRKSRIR